MKHFTNSEYIRADRQYSKYVYRRILDSVDQNFI